MWVNLICSIVPLISNVFDAVQSVSVFRMSILGKLSSFSRKFRCIFFVQSYFVHLSNHLGTLQIVHHGAVCHFLICHLKHEKAQGIFKAPDPKGQIISKANFEVFI